MTSILAGLALLQTPFLLKEGDRVLFYGDSITEQRLYTVYVETFIRTRYPKFDVEFISCGVGGDCTWGGWTGAPDERVRRDVVPEKPTVINIMLGMNDGGYVPFDPKIFSIFQEWYSKLLGYMNAGVPNARITLMSSPPYDDWAHPDTDFKGYSDTVKRFGDYVGVLAKEKKLGFVDMNKPVTEFIQWAMKKDPKKAKEITPDAIHPGPLGHLIMASRILNHWAIDPDISRVVIDTSTGKVEASNLTEITEFKDLQWTQLDRALPYPAEPNLATEYLNFARTFNRQFLLVKGLPEGDYMLRIDDDSFGPYSAKQWAEGVNLSTLKTPMWKQAQKVMELTVQKSNAYFTRWREIDFNLKGYPSTAEASKALRKLTEDIGKEQKETAQPKPHAFRLQKV